MFAFTLCWNAMTLSDQGSVRLFGRPGEPDQTDAATYVGMACTAAAEVAIELRTDPTPGPRLYCVPCAHRYLAERTRP